MKKSNFKLTISLVLMTVATKISAQTGNADINNLYREISTYAGYTFAIGFLLCLIMAGYNFLLAENGAAAGKKYIFGAIGCAIIWAIKDAIINALL
jgi:hypothetical protein